MRQHNDLYCIILAGGKGRRLWPVSRERMPKQFLDFFGTGRTQLQQTFDSFSRMMPADHILVSTNENYASLVAEQLPCLPARNILAEPIYRGTAPSAAWAVHRVRRLQPEAFVVVTPSDQQIIGEEAFERNVDEAVEFIDHRDVMLAMAVRPTRPEPGYGYIQQGACQGRSVYGVKSFTEKPEREFAQMFIDSGEFYWNTGIFVASAASMVGALTKLWPPVLRLYDSTHPGAYDVDEENAYMRDNFTRYPNMSLDNAVLERSDGVYMLRCDFGWADLGTWHSIYEARQRSPGDNVVVSSEALLEGCHGNIVKMPKDHVAVLSGLDGYIVAESDNVLLVCKKQDSSDAIKKYINEVRMRCGDGYV